MNIGIIGAGKVGTSLGKYFVLSGLSLTGFFDSVEEFAKEAAEFTHAAHITDLEELVNASDTLFITVPDGRITPVWEQIKDMPIQGKYICHCSGALSAEDAFPQIKDKGAFGYSIHPLFAVSDKYHSYKELSHSYFTIEGDESGQDIIKLFQQLGNPVCRISAKDKVRYHLAAAICSNHVVALLEESISLMEECGFDEKAARQALTPIVRGNIDHVLEAGTTASLTGPVERADTTTIQKHLNCLSEEKDRMLYRLLSEKLLEIGKRKNKNRDYSSVEKILCRD